MFEVVLKMLHTNYGGEILTCRSSLFLSYENLPCSVSNYHSVNQNISVKYHPSKEHHHLCDWPVNHKWKQQKKKKLCSSLKMANRSFRNVHWILSNACWEEVDQLNGQMFLESHEAFLIPTYKSQTQCFVLGWDCISHQKVKEKYWYWWAVSIEATSETSSKYEYSLDILDHVHFDNVNFRVSSFFCHRPC